MGISRGKHFRVEAPAKRRLRTPAAFLLLGTLVLALSPMSLGNASADETSTWVLMNGAGELTNRFGSTDVVMVTGIPHSDGSLFPAADIYVIPNQDWFGAEGQELVDVSNPDGVPNTVVGFEVIQWPIYIPTLRTGDFDVVIDDNQDGIYEESVDSVVGFRSDPGFTVTFTGTVSALDKAQMKTDFAAPVQHAAVEAQKILAYVHLFEAFNAVTGKLETAWSLGSLYLDGGFSSVFMLNLGADAVLHYGGKSSGGDLRAWASGELDRAQANLAAGAASILADPPDPNFTTVAPTEPLPVTYDEATADGLYNAFAAASNRTNEAAALEAALLHSIERFDGAAQVNARTYMALQSGAVDDYSRQLVNKLADAASAQASLRQALTDEGLPGTVSTADRDLWATVQARLASTGFEQSELDELRAAGLGDAAIAAWRQEILEVPAAEMPSDVVGSLETASSANSGARQALWDLAVQAANVKDALASGSPPVAEAGSDTSTYEGTSAQLSGAGSYDPEGGAITDYRWDFGDGESATGANVDHTWRDDGTYTVTLTVKNDLGNEASDTITALVANLPPTIDTLTTPSYLATGTDGSFQAHATDPGADDTLTYTWDFGDGTTATGPDVQHTYTSPGSMSGTVTVDDGDGGSQTSGFNIQVVDADPENQPPTADAGADVGADEGTQIMLDGSASTDTDGYIAQAVWDFGDGTSGSGLNAWHLYEEDGTYTATLTVTDNDAAAATDATTVTVSNTPPRINSVAVPERMPTGHDRSFQASVYDQGVHDAVEVHWDFGDGNTATGPSIVHQYTSAGMYSVTVTAQDDDGGESTSQALVAVGPPVADAGEDKTAFEGDVVAFDATGSSPLDGYTSYSWDFGDGTTAGDATPTHTYADDGTYMVTLTVTDDSATTTDTATATVSNADPVLGAVYVPPNMSAGVGADFIAKATDPGTADTHEYTWDFGDGSSAIGPAPSHTYSVEGAYLVDVEVEDDDGGRASESRAVIVGSAGTTGRPDSEGKEFWLGFPLNYSQEPELKLFVTGRHDTTGQATLPGLGISIPFSVTAGEVTTVDVPAYAEMQALDGVEAKGIVVTTLDDVSVYGLNRIQYTTDAYLALPTDILGTDYVVLAYSSLYQGSEFAVVATRNATTVTIVPSADGGGHAAGVPYTVSMNLGDVYQLSGQMPDVTGTSISSDRPVAVLGGHQCANIPLVDGSAPGYCDHLVEELPPTTTWGKHFVTMPLATRTRGDTFRIISAEDGNTVRINGVEVAVLDRGRHHEQLIEGPAEIETSGPVLVGQYSNGSGFDGVTSDPFMMLIPPFEQFLDGYTLSTPASGFQANFVNVVVPTSGAASVSIDGSPVGSDQFVAIGSSGFSGAQIAVELGSHTLTAAQPFGAFAYGFDVDDSYGYPGGMNLGKVATVETLSLTPESTTARPGTEACGDATVRDSDGIVVIGVRVDFAVSGANATTGFETTGFDGIAKFCYSGTAEGTDTLTATLGSLSDTSTVTWVGIGNTPPVADNQSVATVENTAVDVVLSATDAEGDTLTFSIVDMPEHGLLTGLAPQVKYVPEDGFSGADLFTFRVNDGQADSNLATVTVDVAAAPEPPDAVDDGYTTLEDTTLTVAAPGLLSNDKGGLAPLAAAIVIAPTHGSATLSSDGSLAYAPDSDYFGEDVLTYTATDANGLTSSASVQLTVTPVNDPPTATDLAISTQTGIPVPVTLGGHDVDGDALTFTVATAPTHGSLSGSGASLVYTPAAGYVGTDSFTYTASDGQLTSAAATVAITVEPAPATSAKAFGRGWFGFAPLRSDFNFWVKHSAKGLNGRFEMSTRCAGRFKSDTITQFDVAGPSAKFSGTGRWNGNSGYSFVVTAEDRTNRRGGKDAISIDIRDPHGRLVYSTPGVMRLSGGSIWVAGS